MAKTRIALLIASLALVLAVPFSAKAAFSTQAEQSVYVAKDQTIDGSFYSAGTSITIEGNVKGDVICAAQSLVINGNVDGDVICLAQSVTINGKIGGSLRVAGSYIILNGSVGRTAMMAGASVSVSPNATIGWDAVVGGASVELGGKINRDVFGGGSQIRISGTIGRQATLYLGDNRSTKEKDNSNLFITKSAVVNGNLTYTSFKEATVENGSTIKGQLKREDPKWKMAENKTSSSPIIGWVWYRIIAIFAALIVGLVMVSWLNKPIKDATEDLFNRFFKNLGWGFLVLFLTPLAVIILAITFIGLPLALMLMGLWILILYPAKILVAIALGRKITDKCRLLKRYKGSVMASMIVGVVIAWLVFSIPVVGWILSFLSVLVGVGAIWHYARIKS